MLPFRGGFEPWTSIANVTYSSGDEAGLNLTIRDQPIFEDEGQAKQAMDDMANTLRMVRLLVVVYLCYADCVQASSEIERQTEYEHHARSSRRP